ncbi:carboxypeptidase S [Dichomitus squalens]|uniref:Carboxypeptidase S n=1 Tax=Dichomitus squalens TaxID=114155 RepID=A0A4Q9MVJ3_9APHY|nr:carboxypeptidase S [Dichomitus squalens]
MSKAMESHSQGKTLMLESHTDLERGVIPASFGRSAFDVGPAARGKPRTQRSLAFDILKAVVVSFFLLNIPSIHWFHKNTADGTPSLSTQVRIGAIPPNETSEFCPQAAPLLPIKHADLVKKLDAVYCDEDYRLAAYKALSGAVQIPTESYDDLGPVGVDPRWDTFAKLHEYLEKTFPAVFSTLEVTKVNTYGIVLRWQGSDATLLPVLLTAHQDVVPVEPATAKDWIHPPYSGHYDGTWVWGRGSGDDKSDLIASLHAITALLEQGFTPTRTFVWAYGFDEEAAGTQGAGQLAVYLEKEYGANGFAALLDEGGSYGTPYGPSVIFATPSLAEKGYIDIRLEVSTPGGHSSRPPPHTGIGILAALLVALEAHPHDAALVRGGSAYNSTLCAAAYGPTFPEPLRRLAFKAAAGGGSNSDADADADRALEELKDALLAAYPANAALLRTTQAVDLVAGGVKVNALPELASAVVNHRIAQHDRVVGVQAHLAGVVRPLAAQFGLTVDAFGRAVPAGDGRGGHVRLSDAWGTALEPSPVTPTGAGDAYQVLAGTIKATLESARGYNASGVVVAPQLVLGNTDTRYYWALTKNIFRYKHLSEKDRFNGAHTINEAVRAEAWIESIRFYTRFILNFDEHL